MKRNNSLGYLRQFTSISIVPYWWKMVKSDWFLIMWWIVETPFGDWHFFRYRIWFGEGIAANVVSVWRHRLQYILLHDFICYRDEIIVYTASWLGWIFVSPVYVFVVSWNIDRNNSIFFTSQLPKYYKSLVIWKHISCTFFFSKQNSLSAKKNKTKCAPSSLYRLVLLCNSNEYLYKQYIV